MLEIDTTKLSELFRDFYSLTNIQICLFDDEYNEILRYPEKPCAFCAQIRENEAVNKACVANDRLAFEKCKSTRSRYTYRCHMDLIETATPIIFERDIIGYVMIGQIADAFSRFETVSPKLDGHAFDLEKLKTLHESIPYIPDEKISAAAHIVDACASYLYVYKLIKSQSESITGKIEGFVDKNLKRPITVDMLCRELHTSRTELYALFDRLFHTSVAGFIKKKRIDRAKKMLKETSLPINKIAVACGIPDYNYFSKIFKKETGRSAAAFRKSPD